MAKDLNLAARLTLDAQRWTQGLGRAEKGTKGFVAGAKRELASLKSAFGSVQGQIAGLGVSIGATALIMQSAKMDKGLTRIKQTANLTAAETKKLRSELFAMAKESGQNVDDLQGGFSTLAAGGLEFKAALPTIQAINKNMAVTGSTAETLSGALLSAQEHFGFDLSKPEVAMALLDKMTVAGRAGVIEIEDLSGAFASSAANAKLAGLNIDQTLALFEGLGTATTKDRLGTLVDSTLRIFTNKTYRDAAQKATGVSFFDGQNQRDPLAVLSDMKGKLDAIKGDKSKLEWLGKAFGKTDMDTQKGLLSAFKDGKLDKILEISRETARSAGTTAKDFPEAIAGAADQAGRLKSTLREAADGFARPINDAIAGVTKKLLDKKEDGGMGLSGNQLAAGGALGLLGLYVGGRLGAKALGKISGLAGGVGAGKALEAAAGVMPVYVVNMPGGGMGGGMDSLLPGGKKAGGTWAAIKAARAAGLARLAGMGTLGGAGATSVGTLWGAGAYGAATLGAAGVGAFGAGYGVGTIINDNAVAGTKLGDMIGAGVTRALAAFGNSQAQEAVRNMDKYEKSLLEIRVSSDGQAVVKNYSSNNPSRHMRVNSGRMMNRGRKP